MSCAVKISILTHICLIIANLQTIPLYIMLQLNESQLAALVIHLVGMQCRVIGSYGIFPSCYIYSYFQTFIDGHQLTRGIILVLGDYNRTHSTKEEENRLNYSCKRGSKKREVAKDSQYVYQDLLFHTKHTDRQPPSHRRCYSGIPTLTVRLCLCNPFLCSNVTLILQSQKNSGNKSVKCTQGRYF